MMESEEQVSWQNLLDWLKSHGMDTETVLVERRKVPGTAYHGLFARRKCEPKTVLFTVPKLLNTKTLSPHYPSAAKKLSAVQLISLHLLLHQPAPAEGSPDPLFGPYISVLPRNFDYHPLSKLVKEDNSPLLPPSTSKAVQEISIRFHNDLATICSFVHNHLEILHTTSTSKTPSDFASGLENESLVSDYLWSWLNVNTRCIYYEVKTSPADLDNITLCPILDFANHTPHLPYMSPSRPPSNKRINMGRDFTLVSPATTSVDADSELFLKYGDHCNRVLYVEYGFVLPLDCDPGSKRVYEVNVDDIVEGLFMEKGEVGMWMKEVLVLENYWGDWTMHFASGSAFSSYRLTTAIRLFSIFPAGSIPLLSEEMLLPWKDVVLGRRDELSTECEAESCGVLERICTTVVNRASQALANPVLADHDSIRTLWAEEQYVAHRILEQMKKGKVF